LVDSDPNADELAIWYGQAIAFPTVVNSDRDPLVLCHAEVTTALAVPALHAVLDPVLDRMDEGEWCEHGSPDHGDGTERDDDDDEDWLDQGILRGTVAFEGDRLDVEANSVARMERLLATITTAVPDAEVVVDERTDLRHLLPSQVGSAAVDGDDAGDLRSAEGQGEAWSAEAEAVLDRFMRRKELEWVDESIPALGGLTPRQALDDPTRREDLLALVRELDRSPGLGNGGQGFDAGRIRSLLGLDP
jgi:hypothetical protein